MAVPPSGEEGEGPQELPVPGEESGRSGDPAGATEQIDPFENQAVADPLVMLCDTLAEEYGLTPREREIAELLARGRSKAYIAETRFISENTVRGHVKRLYLKLDVHSKQELVDLIESLGDRAVGR